MCVWVCSWAGTEAPFPGGEEGDPASTSATQCLPVPGTRRPPTHGCLGSPKLGAALGQPQQTRALRPAQHTGPRPHFLCRPWDLEGLFLPLQPCSCTSSQTSDPPFHPITQPLVLAMGGSRSVPGPGCWDPQWHTSSLTHAQAAPTHRSPRGHSHPFTQTRESGSPERDEQDALGQTEVHYEGGHGGREPQGVQSASWRPRERGVALGQRLEASP